MASSQGQNTFYDTRVKNQKYIFFVFLSYIIRNRDSEIIRQEKNMNRKKHGNYRCILLVLVLWLFWFQNVSASQMLFPFVADDWISFEGRTFLQLQQEKKQTEIKKQRNHKKSNEKSNKISNKKKVKETMAVPVKYDNEISAGDRQILYKAVSMECDTGYEGSLAVISCMLNRLESDKYPDDLMDVVREKAQFSAYYDKKTETYPYIDRNPSQECIQAVDDALAGKKRNLPSYIMYFRASSYKKLKGYKKYGQIGDNTYFYKEEDR